MKEQMSTVISELSKIENAAVEIIEDTEVRQKNFANEMDEKTKKFDEALAMETQDHLKKIGEELNKKSADDIEKLKIEAQEELDELEKSYEDNHTQWAKDILESLIKE